MYFQRRVFPKSLCICLCIHTFSRRLIKSQIWPSFILFSLINDFNSYLKYVSIVDLASFKLSFLTFTIYNRLCIPHSKCRQFRCLVHPNIICIWNFVVIVILKNIAGVMIRITCWYVDLSTYGKLIKVQDSFLY